MVRRSPGYDRPHRAHSTDVESSTGVAIEWSAGQRCRVRLDEGETGAPRPGAEGARAVAELPLIQSATRCDAPGGAFRRLRAKTASRQALLLLSDELVLKPLGVGARDFSQAAR